MAAAEIDESVHGRLRAMVLSLDLMPGERLSERGLEAVLGASRTPIRAALMRLENEGLTRREGRGWQVTPLDVTEVRAVMEYREALEVGGVSLAIERADNRDLASLRSLAEEHRHRDDAETDLRDGADFHVALVRLSGNPFLADAVAGAMVRLARTRWLEVRTSAARTQARDEHLAIVDAVGARNTAQAVDLVRAHSRGTRDRLLTSLTDERRRLRGRGFAIVETAAPAVLRAV